MAEFSFTDPKVLETLLAARRRGTEFMGSATSDFQSHPRLHRNRRETRAVSDWEREVARAVGGKTSKILGPQSPDEFPRFFDKKELYIRRSADLGENMFRLSFDFGKLCPAPGVFNKRLMEEYVQILALIRDRGEEPMITLYHWPTPAHLLVTDKEDRILAGAWEHHDVLHHFRFYIKSIIGFLSDNHKVNAALTSAGFNKEKREKFLGDGLVRYFISINEPINLLLPTYLLGIFPPFKKGRIDLVRGVLSKLIEAHDAAVSEIKESKLASVRGKIQVGAAHNWTFFDGLFGKVAHAIVNTKLARKFEREARETDFVGLHYYFRMKLALFGKGGRFYSDNPYFGDIHPPGIEKVLKEMHAEYPHKNIFITEFGFSDRGGKRRPYWILETVRHVIAALEHEIPMKGMLLWTLVNNFEWNLGMDQKFGLFGENELAVPLVPTPLGAGTIKSWEAWQAAVRAVTQPTPRHLRELQLCYETAKAQFHAHLAKRPKRPWWCWWC